MIKSEELKLHNRNEFTSNLLQTYGQNPGFVLLESTLDSSDSRTIVFLEPLAKICSDNSSSYVESAEQKFEFENPWQAIQDWLSPAIEYISEFAEDQSIPFSSGYLGYELLHSLEDVPPALSDLYKVPDSILYLYRTVIVIEHSSNLAKVHRLSLDQLPKPIWEISDLTKLQEFKMPELNKIEHFDLQLLEEASNFSKASYSQAVDQIKDLIKAGDVYQVNLSQQFRLPYQKDPRLLYQALRTVSPVGYAAYLHFNDFSVISTSPERFFKSERTVITSSPIKGTRPRLDKPGEDLKNLTELKSSEKDLAELSMIVDLIRNDMGKIAEMESVRVVSHARVESFAQVHHLVSDISCQQRHDTSIVDVIKALFPCGSVTGCPKVAAMKYISEFEQTTRGVYTGSIGWFGTNNSAEWNVAIRTGIVKDNVFTFQSGGGIVYDSIAKDEYEETIAKALGMYQAYRLLVES
ncbi:MAG: anthranilate synthase component I family protein [Deltaproteobacteria bacterium]|nr:anthranilate synthase component I family protein [Deltaproteobacteria bacterium]